MTLYKIFSLGSNSGCQLAVNHDDDLYAPTPTFFQKDDTNDEELHDGEIEANGPPVVIGGGNHTFVYVEGSTTYYACGSNSCGELGLTIDEPKSDQPSHRQVWTKGTVPNGEDSCEIREKVVQMAAGWNHSLMLTSSGSVYSCGDNSFGQCGIGNHAGKCMKEWAKVALGLDGDDKVKAIACGMRHAVVITEKGRLFGWGANRHGQLGFQSKPPSPTSARPKRMAPRYWIEWLPKSITTINGVLGISCGRHHTACVLETDKIAVAGDNKYGQMGRLETGYNKCQNANNSPWNEVQLEQKIHYIVSGWDHIIALFRPPNAGELGPFSLTAWGRSDHGQLGNPIPHNSSILEVACGSNHALVLDEKKHVLSWGWNEHGNCGDSSLNDVLEPRRVDLPSDCEQQKLAPVKVGCGYGNSYIICALLDN
ncbi:hypothetical protein H4219_000480 [Mycoemilia scoparia]|uniref:RCC1-like domain-containing protein n=1 Tax=Mycoemilia scoparia TaxID=417184 RepID=A0A9W8DWZ3_9FUNG|nr:hypothetical protein H4219_000480 [Mycoemilia scoparia]